METPPRYWKATRPMRDYKSDYLTAMNNVQRRRQRGTVHVDARTMYLSLLLNATTLLVALSLFQTIAWPVGILLLIAFVVSTLKQSQSIALRS